MLVVGDLTAVLVLMILIKSFLIGCDVVLVWRVLTKVLSAVVAVVGCLTTGTRL